VRPEGHGNGRASAAIVDKVYNLISRAVLVAAASSGVQVSQRSFKPGKFRLQQDANGDILALAVEDNSP
jgi:hypothetical protein